MWKDATIAQVNANVQSIVDRTGNSNCMPKGNVLRTRTFHLKQSFALQKFCD